MECEDYHCRCESFQGDGMAELFGTANGPAYCVCGCIDEDHGKGFRAAEQSSADEARTMVEEIFRGNLGQN